MVFLISETKLPNSSIPTAWKGVSEPLFYLAKIPTGLNISTMFLGYLAGTVVPFLIGDSAPALG